MSPIAQFKQSPHYKRTLGGLLTLLSPAIIYFAYILPYQDALAGRPVTLSITACLFSTLAPVIGPTMLIFGDRSNIIMGGEHHPKNWALPLGLICSIAGIGGYFYLRHVLTGLGYTF